MEVRGWRWRMDMRRNRWIGGSESKTRPRTWTRTRIESCDPDGVGGSVRGAFLGFGFAFG